MFVVTRKVGQEIVVGSEILIRVLQVRGARVRLGVVAPHAMPVRREEGIRARLSRPLTDPTGIGKEAYDV
jgi:carbon storage regulator